MFIVATSHTTQAVTLTGSPLLTLIALTGYGLGYLLLQVVLADNTAVAGLPIQNTATGLGYLLPVVL